MGVKAVLRIAYSNKLQKLQRYKSWKFAIERKKSWKVARKVEKELKKVRKNLFIKLRLDRFIIKSEL